MGFQDEQASPHGEGMLIWRLQCAQAGSFWFWLLGVVE